MTPPFQLRTLPASAIPGQSEAGRRYLAGEALDFASPVFTSVDAVRPRGPAWDDDEFVRERADALTRMQAPAASHEALQRLRDPATALVVTGQQPGLMGGSIMSVLKVMGAVALAEAIERAGTPCVAVYWCGADDSDFAEVRGTWLWANQELVHAALPDRVWTPGQRVGDLAGPELAATERSALDQLGRGEGRARLQREFDRLPSDLDFGERSQAWLLHLLAGRPLLTVDARSPRLRALGHPLFAGYVERHREIFDQLSARTQQLTEAGLAPPLALDALQSGLFALGPDGTRAKVAPHELDGLGDRDVTPSVMLRPVWQDALLAPAAAVLGPAEFAYHLQLTPLYRALEVGAAAPAPRPHLVDWPGGLPWPTQAPHLDSLLSGGETAAEVLQEMALPSNWAEALARAERTRGAALENMSEVDASLPRPEWHAHDKETHRRWRRDLARRALAERVDADAVWGWASRWLRPRGVPQERLLNATTGWWRWGDTFDAILDRLGSEYVSALTGRTSPAFASVEAESE